MTTFNDYLTNILDWELKQKSETGDAAGIDAKRILPKAQAKITVSECIKYFAMNNQSRFRKEFTYTFDGYTTEFVIPSYILKVEGYKVGNKWYVVPDSSDTQSAIRRVSHNKIINTNGWQKGDQLVLSIIDKPVTIVNDDDVVNFPDEWLRLLTLEVKKRAYSRQGKGLSKFEFAELTELKKNWAKDVGIVRYFSRISYQGRRFGRRHR